MQRISQQPVRDKNGAHPIADAWRPRLREIVTALAEGDYDLSRGIPFVAPTLKATADQIRAYIEDFGDALTALPDETWESSTSQWMGTHWDVVVDLWTVESGRSDL